MSKLSVNELTDETGSGAPSFPNGVSVTGAALTDPEITGGIFLGGTGTANKLDDYETGTWTPEWNVDVGYAHNDGSYVKIGRTVFAFFDIQTSGAPSTTVSDITLRNLPFPSIFLNTQRAASGFAKDFGNNWDSGNQPQWFLFLEGTTTAQPQYESSGLQTLLPSSALGDSTRISGTLIYETDS